jgi:hypothetical protein
MLAPEGGGALKGSEIEVEKMPGENPSWECDAGLGWD